MRFSWHAGACPPRMDFAHCTVGRGPVPRRAPVFAANVRGLWAAGVSRFGGDRGGQAPALRSKRRFSCRSNTRGGQALALREKTPPPHRRARACPSPCAGLNSKRPWTLGCGSFSVWRGDRGGQAPALRSKRRFSCESNNRGGQAPALRKKGFPVRSLGL